MTETVFQFDPERSLGSNFNIWNDLNQQERELYNEPRLDHLEAIKLFATLHNVSAIDVQDDLAREAKNFGFKLK